MHIKNEKEMQEFAKQFLRECSRGPLEHSRATVVALHGDLGAGKSTFVRAVARELGITEKVVSPTFNIMKIYKCERGPLSHLVHIDAYRLKGEKDLKVLDWQELISDRANIIFIEWPENVESALPKHTEHLYFKYISEDTRSIEYRQDQG